MHMCRMKEKLNINFPGHGQEERPLSKWTAQRTDNRNPTHQLLKK